MIRATWMIGVALLVAGPAEAADQATILAEYQALLAIPNVATNVADIRRNADHIMAMMVKRGLAPGLLEGDNANVPPAIYGEWPVPGARRTLVLYAHYDGQPVTPEDWKSTQLFQPKLYSATASTAAAKPFRCRLPDRSTRTGGSTPAPRRTISWA
jgi:hypothetical protein